MEDGIMSYSIYCIIFIGSFTAMQTTSKLNPEKVSSMYHDYMNV